MKNNTLDQSNRAPDAAHHAAGHRSPKWAKVCLVIAAVLMGFGLVRPMLGSGESRPDAAQSGTDFTGAHSLTGATVSRDASEAGEESGRTRSAAFRLGFSFAAAFAAAYAMRKFFNFTLASLGMFLAVLFGLQFAGIIEVKWVAFQGDYDGAADWLKSQFDSFQSFIKGALPSSAAAATGLFAGWRRKG